MRSKLAHALALLLLFCAAAHAQEYKPLVETRSPEALRGVEVVRLLVEVTPQPGQRAEMAALVERGAAERLRAAGLRALTGDDARAVKSAPVFSIRLMLYNSGCGFTLTEDVQLRETVRLARRPATETTAATWQRSAHGLFYPPDEARVVEGVLHMVESFVKDYREANGR